MKMYEHHFFLMVKTIYLEIMNVISCYQLTYLFFQLLSGRQKWDFFIRKLRSGRLIRISVFGAGTIGCRSANRI